MSERLNYSGRDYSVRFEDLLGLTLASIENRNDEALTFTTTEGRVFQMWHEQDCCESVTLEDIAGNLEDLIGTPITMAEEVTGGAELDPPGMAEEDKEWRDSFLWTFYKLATVKGYVTLRWYGESNGYYSESVTFAEVVR